MDYNYGAERPKLMRSVTNMSRLTTPNQKILEILQSAWEGERENEERIHRLMSLAKDPLDKETLRMIYMDEHKHIKYFGDIYQKQSGYVIPKNIRVTQRSICWDLCSEFEKMIHKYTDNVEFYRRIYFVFSDQQIRDILFEIITDEINIAIKMTHMCNKNREFF